MSWVPHRSKPYASTCHHVSRQFPVPFFISYLLGQLKRGCFVEVYAEHENHSNVDPLCTTVKLFDKVQDLILYLGHGEASVSAFLISACARDRQVLRKSRRAQLSHPRRVVPSTNPDPTLGSAPSRSCARTHHRGGLSAGG